MRKTRRFDALEKRRFDTLETITLYFFNHLYSSSIRKTTSVYGFFMTIRRFNKYVQGTPYIMKCHIHIIEGNLASNNRQHSIYYQVVSGLELQSLTSPSWLLQTLASTAQFIPRSGFMIGSFQHNCLEIHRLSSETIAIQETVLNPTVEQFSSPLLHIQVAPKIPLLSVTHMSSFGYGSKLQPVTSASERFIYIANVSQHLSQMCRCKCECQITRFYLETTTNSL